MMEANVKTLVEQSIEKWEGKYSDLVAAKNKNKATPFIAMSPKSCPLCNGFLLVESSCDRCPISERTNEECCVGSPYEKASNQYNEFFEDSRVPNDELLQAFRDEIDFLKSLLLEAEV